MTTRIMLHAGALVLSFTVSGAAPVLAADEPIEEILVTGSRTPVETGRIGVDFSVLDGAWLEARDVPQLSLVLRDLPGVAVSRTGPIGSLTQVRIRGAEANHTLVLLDGIEMNDPVSGFELDFADVSSAGIARVELIRGASSALYGSEALGGVIQLVSRLPDEPRALDLRAEGGSFGTLRTEGFAGFREGASAGALTAAFYRTDGVSASPSGPERDGYRNVTLHGRLESEPGEHIAVGLVGRFVDARSEFDDQDFLTGAVVDADNVRRFTAFYGRAHARLSLFGDRWTHQVAVDLTDTSTRNFADGAFTGRFAGTRVKLGYQSTAAFETGSLDHRITGAVEYERLRFRVRGASADAPQNQRRHDRQISLVGEYHLGVADRLFVDAAARHDDNRIFRNATTWRLSGLLRLTAQLAVTGNVGNGNADPTFFERYGFFPGSFVGNPDLKPERGRGFDAGVRITPSSAWTIELVGFHGILKDEITTIFDFATFTSTPINQEGRSTRNGFEADLAFSPVEVLTVRGFYSFVKAQEPDGAPEVRRPKHRAGLGGTWRFAGSRGLVNLDVAYNGRQRDFDFSRFPAERVRLASYWLASVSLRWRVKGPVWLTARIENLFDSDYQDVLGFNTPGIGAFAGLAARF
ncbi:MAG: TonB-dependent receptor [Rhodothalassiaceae bacterium]|nr:MAG: TonB-dependent receptor [Rhodothalassiaceae bacterium]